MNVYLYLPYDHWTFFQKHLLEHCIVSQHTIMLGSMFTTLGNIKGYTDCYGCCITYKGFTKDQIIDLYSGFHLDQRTLRREYKALKQEECQEKNITYTKLVNKIALILGYPKPYHIELYQKTLQSLGNISSTNLPIIITDDVHSIIHTDLSLSLATDSLGVSEYRISPLTHQIITLSGSRYHCYYNQYTTCVDLLLILFLEYITDSYAYMTDRLAKGNYYYNTSYSYFFSHHGVVYIPDEYRSAITDILSDMSTLEQAKQGFQTAIMHGIYRDLPIAFFLLTGTYRSSDELIRSLQIVSSIDILTVLGDIG